MVAKKQERRSAQTRVVGEGPGVYYSKEEIKMEDHRIWDNRTGYKVAILTK